jgi:hypothetical protein
MDRNPFWYSGGTHPFANTQWAYNPLKAPWQIDRFVTKPYKGSFYGLFDNRKGSWLLRGRDMTPMRSHNKEEIQEIARQLNRKYTWWDNANPAPDQRMWQLGPSALNPRPPKEWWDEMFVKVKKTYSRKTSVHPRITGKARLSAIVGHIWWSLKPKTRKKLIKYYDSQAKV